MIGCKRARHRGPGRLLHGADAVHPGARVPGGNGCYDIPAVRLDFKGVFTNKFPTDAIRGAGRPEVTHFIEMMMDQLAARAGMDPLEIAGRTSSPPTTSRTSRARHRLRLRQLPGHARQAARARRHGGVPARAGRGARRASTAASASRPTWRSAAWRRRARSARRASACRPRFCESAVVRVHPTGSATVYSGTSPHGQGLDTGFAQIAADRLGIDPQNVEVIHGDTDRARWAGTPTARARWRSAARRSHARPTRCRTRPSASARACWRRRPRTSSWSTASSRSRARPTRPWRWSRSPARRTSRRRSCPRHRAGLEETSFYDPENFVFPFGAHACVVDVDAETGKVEVVR